MKQTELENFKKQLQRINEPYREAINLEKTKVRIFVAENIFFFDCETGQLFAIRNMKNDIH